MNKNFYHNYFEIEKSHWLMKVRRMIIKDVLQQNLTDPKKGKILDFGCGSGILVGELSREGYNSYGVDVSEEAIKFGELNGIKNIKAQGSHKLDYPNNYFEAVLSMDVLEHIEDESWVVKEIYRVLKPGGMFAVMVPAYMFLWGVQDEVAHHYRRYTLTSLKKVLFDNADFKLVRSSYFNTFLFLPIAAVRITSRLFGLKKRQSDFDLNNPFLDKILFFIFNLERKILKRINFSFGVSIILILKK